MLESETNIDIGTTNGGQVKDWLLKEDNVYKVLPDGNKIKVSPEHTSSFIQSQDWKSKINSLKNDQSIRVLIRLQWENEFGRKFDEIHEFDLECTLAFNEKRFQFIRNDKYLEANHYSN